MKKVLRLYSVLCTIFSTFGGNQEREKSKLSIYKETVIWRSCQQNLIVIGTTSISRWRRSK